MLNYFCRLAFVFTFMVSPLFQIYPLVDLEETLSSFILETKRIIIPEYPLAFNASLIKWGEFFIMSFRIIPERKSSFTSKIGLVKLDCDFNPIGKAQILDLREDCLIPSRAEDARLIQVQDKLYMIYSDNKDMHISKGGYRVYVAEITLQEGSFIVQQPERLVNFEGASQNIREKNWVPFVFEGNLLLAYSLFPHRILSPFLDGSESCFTVALSESPLNWSWGEPRGGTTAQIIDDYGYLSFFHSSLSMESVQSNGKKILHYFIGAYLFESNPPFSITHISLTPIVGKGFYNGEVYKHYWKPVRAVFPCGYIHDESHIWIAYGRQDHEIWIVKLDKQGLLDSLVPVKANIKRE